jgi:hypothetical protein
MLKKIITNQTYIWILLFISLIFSSTTKQAISAANSHFLELITKAGNSSDEKDRFRYLKKAATISNLDELLEKQLDDILLIVDYWANDSYSTETIRKNAAENGYLCDFFNRKIDLKKSIFPDIPEDSPLYPIRCMYRGRMLIQGPIQSGTLKSNPELRNAYYRKEIQ